MVSTGTPTTLASRSSGAPWPQPRDVGMDVARPRRRAVHLGVGQFGNASLDVPAGHDPVRVDSEHLGLVGRHQESPFHGVEVGVGVAAPITPPKKTITVSATAGATKT